MTNTIPWWAGAVLTSALTLILGAVAISFDRRKTVNQELIKKRIAVYDEMAPKLNDILCFFLCIGSFKDLPPPTIIALKRELDRLIYVYQTIFSPKLRQRYDAYIELCYDARRGGRGRPAPIRANRKLVEAEWGGDWQVGWSSMLVEVEAAVHNDRVKEHYEELMRQFAIELRARGRDWFPGLSRRPPRKRAD